MTRRKIRIELYPQQVAFVTAEARRVAFVAGIGAGKTLAGCVRALRMAAEWPGSLGLIAAPTYPMLRDATLRTFRRVAGEALVSFNKSEMLATLINGSEILFRSTDDPERLRGPNLSWAYLDEAALMSETAWLILLGRVREEGRAGSVWLTTTPKGRNWVWEQFVRDGGAERVLVKARTQDNPYLAREFVEGLERDYTGRFAAQELSGEFVAFEGLVYEEFAREVHVWGGELPRFERVIAGVDWGYTNPAVVVVLGEDSDGRLFVVDEYYRRQERLAMHVAAAKAMGERWGVEAFFCDPSEPEHIAEMQAAGLPALAANNAVLAGIQAVKARLAVRDDGRPRLYVTPQCPNLIAEFEAYAWLKRGDKTLDVPAKEFDHAMDALRYAVVGSTGRVEYGPNIWD